MSNGGEPEEKEWKELLKDDTKLWVPKPKPQEPLNLKRIVKLTFGFLAYFLLFLIWVICTGSIGLVIGGFIGRIISDFLLDTASDTIGISTVFLSSLILGFSLIYFMVIVAKDMRKGESFYRRILSMSLMFILFGIIVSIFASLSEAYEEMAYLLFLPAFFIGFILGTYTSRIELLPRRDQARSN